MGHGRPVAIVNRHRLAQQPKHLIAAAAIPCHRGAHSKRQDVRQGAALILCRVDFVCGVYGRRLGFLECATCMRLVQPFQCRRCVVGLVFVGFYKVFAVNLHHERIDCGHIGID